MTTNEQRIQKAKEVLVWRQLSEECTAGEVSAALLTASGNIYTGVSISAACGIGFCAEHGAVAQMVTKGETQIVKLVAISDDGHFLPPCGHCRELLYEIDRHNLRAEIILDTKLVRLSNLLSEPWQAISEK